MGEEKKREMGTYDKESQRLSMRNKPKPNQQTHRRQNRDNSQPILPCPPERQQKTHPQHNTRDFTSHNIETTEYE
jgi:hypothetical protein